jgi:hypothetical protein
MNLTDCADCAPAYTTVALLLLGALLALIIARRARWSVLVTVPLSAAALELFAGQDYATGPRWGLLSWSLGCRSLALCAGHAWRTGNRSGLPNESLQPASARASEAFCGLRLSSCW